MDRNAQNVIFIKLWHFSFWQTDNTRGFAKVNDLRHDICLWQCMIYVYTVHRPKLVQLQWFDLKRAFNIYSRFLKINPNITILSHFESIVSLIWADWDGFLFCVFVLSLLPLFNTPTLLLRHEDLHQPVELPRQPDVVLSSDVILQRVLPAVHVPAQGTTKLHLESRAIFIWISQLSITLGPKPWCDHRPRPWPVASRWAEDYAEVETRPRS